MRPHKTQGTEGGRAEAPGGCVMALALLWRSDQRLFLLTVKFGSMSQGVVNMAGGCRPLVRVQPFLLPTSFVFDALATLAGQVSAKGSPES